MIKTLTICLLIAGCLKAQSPTPAPTPEKTGRYIYINLDIIESVNELSCIPGAFNVDYGRDISTVIGNPLMATPVFDHFVRMELTTDKCGQ